MRRVTYSMGMTADGFVVGPDGRFDWGAPDAEEFRASIDEVRGVDVHLLGRRLHETMVYWEDPVQAATWGDAEREWADLWNALPKVVFSAHAHQRRREQHPAGDRDARRGGRAPAR